MSPAHFDWSLNSDKICNIAGFYGLPKINKPKNKTPGIHPLHTVVRIVDTIDTILSNYINYILNP